MLAKMEIIGVIILVPLYLVSAFVLGASITAGLFVFHVAVVPLIFKYSKTFQRSLVFANFVRWPLFIDLEDPGLCGVEGGRNLSIQFHSKVDRCSVKIGVWHILPKSTYEKLKDKFTADTDKEELNQMLDDELANSTKPVMFYCHGNSCNRSALHRVKLYKLLQKMDFHTIAFDYRGYGDSTNIHPSEPGVVEDSLVVYEWLHNTIDKSECKPAVFVWGHSLGTGISSHLLGNLEELSTTVLDRSTPLPLPKGLILEAPFNNLADEVAKHPLSKLVTWLPYYDNTFVTPFRHSKEYTFTSDLHLLQVSSLPILILHAKDDIVVPYVVGLKLYNSLKESRRESGGYLKLHSYDESLGIGHKWIVKADDLPQVLGEFFHREQAQ